MQADFPIFGDYKKREEYAFNSEDLVNLFMIESRSGKKKLAFLNTPGLKKEKIVQEGAQQSRALLVLGEYMYGVFGANVYRFSSDLLPTAIGSIGTASGYVSIYPNNANQICFVDGQDGYLYKVATGSFARITAAGFPDQPLNVVSLDGYLVIPLGESKTFQISALNNGEAWDAADNAVISSYPGVNVGVGVVNRRLFFFKTDSIEVWFNSGNADFPFRRDNNLLFNYGCLATQSIVSGFGMLFWLARDSDGVGSVMMTTGQEPKRISDDSIDDLIASFSDQTDVSVYLYKDSGHIFLNMSWTTDDVTLLYDVTMDSWQRLEMQEKSQLPNVRYSGNIRHLSSCHAYFNNKHYIGSYKKPILYSMSRSYAMNDDEPIKRMVASRHFFDPNYKMLQINSIQVDMQTGIGVSGSGTGVYSNPNDDPLINPKCYLALARDGQPFGNDAPAPIGKLGDTRARVIWRQKGQARDIVGRFSIYVPVAPIVILGASINYEVLSK